MPVGLNMDKNGLAEHMLDCLHKSPLRNGIAGDSDFHLFILIGLYLNIFCTNQMCYQEGESMCVPASLVKGRGVALPLERKGNVFSLRVKQL